MPPGQTEAFGDTLSIADDVERFCLINLSADIEHIAYDDLEGEGYEQRLEQAKARLRDEHELHGDPYERGAT
jgi:hypothetical protein